MSRSWSRGAVAKPRPNAGVVDWLRSQSPLDLAISVLSLGEVRKGVSLMPTGTRREALEQWLANELPRQFFGRVLPVDEAAALAWGRLSAEGRASGRELPVIYGLLLATAAAHRLTFVTRNESDCKERGVAIHNPWDQ